MTVPAYILEAVPAVREVAEALAKAEAEAAETRRVWKAASKAAFDLGRWDDGKRVPTHGVLSADFEAASENARLAEDADKKAMCRAEILRKKLDAAMRDANATDLHAVAARHALAKQEEAAAAWAALKAALDERDEAWRIAGRPGRDWKTRVGAMPNRFDGGASDAATIIETRLTIDVAALETVANGETAPTQADLDAAAETVAEEAAKLAARAARRRDVAEGRW